MKRLIGPLALYTLLFWGYPYLVSAQVASPSNHLAWTEVGQAAAISQTATFNAYVDTATTGVALSGVTCAADTTTPANADCVGNFPALTPGSHTLTLTELLGGSESPKSTPLAFTFVVVITPTGLKVVELRQIYSVTGD